MSVTWLLCYHRCSLSLFSTSSPRWEMCLLHMRFSGGFFTASPLVLSHCCLVIICHHTSVLCTQASLFTRRTERTQEALSLVAHQREMRLTQHDGTEVHIHIPGYRASYKSTLWPLMMQCTTKDCWYLSSTTNQPPSYPCSWSNQHDWLDLFLVGPIHSPLTEPGLCTNTRQQEDCGEQFVEFDKKS